jgi:hypothetical protein
MKPQQSNFDTCQKFRTRPYAVIVKPYAVSVLNALLRSYAGGIIDYTTLNSDLRPDRHWGHAVILTIGRGPPEWG